MALSIDLNKDALEQRKAKLLEAAAKKKEKQNKKAVMDVPSDIVEEMKQLQAIKKRKKADRSTEPEVDPSYYLDEVVTSTYPLEASFMLDPLSLLSEARNVLLPEDDKRLKSLGHKKAGEHCLIQSIRISYSILLVPL